MGLIMVPSTVHELPCAVQQESMYQGAMLSLAMLLSTATEENHYHQGGMSDVHMVYGMLVHTDTVDMDR